MRIEVSKSYRDLRVLRGLQAEIPEGEIFCLLGASGVGKTALLRILAGLESYEGKMDGVPEKVGYVFQENRLLGHLTAKENLLYVGIDETQADEMLARVKLTDKADVKAKNLSGGEKRRVAIARAFAVKAPLLLLDEPFSAVDTALKIRLAELTARLWESYRPTVVMVTHDIEEAFMLGHTIAVMEGGKIVKSVRVDREKFPSAYGKESEQKQEILKTILKE